jgi:hypothetical protein
MRCCTQLVVYACKIRLTAQYAHAHLQAFEEMGFKVYGGRDAPYVWVGFPGKASWWVTHTSHTRAA